MAATAAEGEERVQKALLDLQTHKTLLTNCTFIWQKLASHFSLLEQALIKKSQALDSKIQALDTRTSETLGTLERRENAIPERENEVTTRIHEIQQSVLAEFDEPPPNSELPPPDVLRSLCRRMDADGLWKFLAAKRKDSAFLRTEVSSAIAEAVDPPRLILDSLDDYLSQKDGKAGLSDQIWACELILRDFFPDSRPMPQMSKRIAERAAAVAEKWKHKVDKEGENLITSEAQMFLQFVVGYGIRSKFEADFLKSLLVRFPPKKGTAKLAYALGFGDKMKDVIEELIKNGKELEAVYVACETGFTDQFPPVPLIKACLKNSRKRANALLKSGNYSMAASEEAGNLELQSVRAIIKCVEDHRLEYDFTLDSLRKRISQLERAKADKKKSAPPKSHKKRLRGHQGSGAGFSSSKGGRLSVRWGTPRPHSNPAPVYTGHYNFPSQGVYEVPPGAAAGPTHTPTPAPVPTSFGGQGQSVVAAPLQHPFVAEDLSGSRSGGSYVDHAGYGGYDYGVGASMAPHHPAYPS